MQVGEKPRIVYIAGYGRSGSTLLDIIFGANPLIFSMGEVSYLFSEIQKNRSCSCREKVIDCPIWKEVLGWESEQLTINELALKQNSITRKTESILGFLAGREFEAYQNIWKPIFNQLSKITQAQILVDSSKVTRSTFFRIRALKRMGYDVSLIHLVRHPLAVANSVAKGSNQAIQYSDPSLNKFGGAYRGVAGWLFSNWATEKFCYPLVDRKIRIRYEDFISFPSETLIEIGKVCEIDLSKSLDIIESNDTFPSGHGIAGNRMRSESRDVRLISKPLADTQQFYDDNFLMLSSVKGAMKRYGYDS